MATGNFKTMENFPLITAKDIYCKICPKCGLTMDGEADKCECGHDLTNVESHYDDILMRERYDELEAFAERINGIGHVADFFTVKVESGYYSGLQFYVDEAYSDIEELNNEDAQYEFGCCRSEMIRRYKVAMNTVCRELRKAVKELWCDELAIFARFSNGETMYSKVA